LIQFLPLLTKRENACTYPRSSGQKKIRWPKVFGYISTTDHDEDNIRAYTKKRGTPDKIKKSRSVCLIDSRIQTAHGLIPALSGSQTKPPALPQVFDFFCLFNAFSFFLQQINNRGIADPH